MSDPEVTTARRPAWARPVAVLAGLFGVVSIVSGSAVLTRGDIGEAAGDYVPFVVWFNVVGGLAYLAGAVGLGLWRRWALPVAILIAAATLAVFVAFGVHVAAGGAFEMRTVAAMTLRSLLWLAIALGLWRRLG